MSQNPQEDASTQSQATMRIVKVFWGLDSSLAYARHFPAINWLNSYSLYADSLGRWFNEHVSSGWTNCRAARGCSRPSPR